MTSRTGSDDLGADRPTGPGGARVAVVVATFRRPEVLRHALRSLIAQRFTDWEAIVVGDACGDHTGDVVAAFADPRLRFVDLAINIGEQSGPNNVGTARTSAPLVAFLNQDDLWFPDHLSVAVDTIDARCADLVFSPNLNVQPRTDDRSAPRVIVDSLSHRGRYDPCQTDRATPASSWLVRRTLLDRLGGWRSASDCIVEPSQDLLFRAHRSGALLVSTGVATVITIASGTRPGSYVDGDVEEHRWMSDRLDQPDLRARLLAHAISGSAPTSAGLAGRLLESVTEQVMRTAARVGVSPRRIAYRRRGLRRGERLDHLRRIRGLDPSISRTGTSTHEVRRAEVLRTCDVPPGRIHMGADGDGHRITALGWSSPEPWGVWSDGRCAELALRPTVPGRYVLSLHVHPHLPPGTAAQRVDVTVDGTPSAPLILSDPTPGRFDVTFTARPGRTTSIRLGLPDAVEPPTEDRRLLGVGLHAVELELVPCDSTDTSGRTATFDS